MLTRSKGGGGDAFCFFPSPIPLLPLCVSAFTEAVAGVMRFKNERNLDFLSLVAGAMGSSVSAGHPFPGLPLSKSIQPFAGHEVSSLGSRQGFTGIGEEGGVKSEVGG